MKRAWFIWMLLFGINAYSQDLGKKISEAIKSLEADPQFRHSIMSFYVEDGKTSSIVFNKNEQTGLVPASVQKILTSVAGFELLGKSYRYTTSFSHDGMVENGTLKGNLRISASGDPSFGSDRFAKTSGDLLLKNISRALKTKGITKIIGELYFEPVNWESAIPDRWIWEDVGNYFGASAELLNWRENSYELKLASGKNPGDSVSIINTVPKLYGYNFQNQVKAGAKGSGDNAWIYFPVGGQKIIVKGSIPPAEKSFSIYGAMPDPARQFRDALLETLSVDIKAKEEKSRNVIKKNAVLYEHQSPSYDSLNYWFMRKSINLYGEAFLKTMALANTDVASTDSGVAVLKEIFSKIGIEGSALNIYDGSGLSPSNRITTHSLVKILSFAKRQKWFSSFYDALPLMNELKMKDGYMSGTRSYAGYVKGKGGRDYTFAFIVNNFDGSAATVREKIYKVLDLLK